MRVLTKASFSDHAIDDSTEKQQLYLLEEYRAEQKHNLDC
jgi:hypothetical protein